MMNIPKSIFICLLAVCLMFAGGTGAFAAYTLSLEATSDGTTPKTEFQEGDDLYLNIILTKEPADVGIAGCAFTLEYPTDQLDPPTTDANGDPDVPTDLSSIFPFSFANPNPPNETGNTRKFNTANDPTDGDQAVIYFSGAEIYEGDGDPADTGDGGAIAQADNQVLFTARFTVKTGATQAAINFVLRQTVLWNPDAGYGDDSGSTLGVYDPGEDATGTVPVLVGAAGYGEAGFDTLTSCTTPGDCAFPILLDTLNVSYSGATVEASTEYDTWKSANFPGIGAAGDDDDGDGLTNDEERLLASAYGGPYDTWTDPTLADTDADGIDDDEEVAGTTDPTNWDTDSDGIGDGNEINVYGTDPLEIDSDFDGRRDVTEILDWTDPNNPADFPKRYRFFGDFDGDGSADILYRDWDNGQVKIWLMNGVGKKSVGVPGTLGLSWEIVAVGNFNGDVDSNDDILWRNIETGELEIWLMNGTSILSSGSPGTESNIDNEIVALGHFNGDIDNNIDILFHNQTNGKATVWLIDGTGTGKLQQGTPGTLADLNWKIVGVGQFNTGTDGNADILWHNQATGKVTVWMLNGKDRIDSGSPGQLKDLNWKIAGIGNFNKLDTGIGADDNDDILWYNTATGKVLQWYLDGKTRIDAGKIGQFRDLNWTCRGAFLFNGDGDADILYHRVSDGRAVIWEMNSKVKITKGTPGSLDPAVWVIAGMGDFDGDGDTDMLWVDPAAGDLKIWLLDGKIKVDAGSPGGLSPAAGWELQ